MIYKVRRHNPMHQALAMRRAMDELFNDMDFQWGPRGMQKRTAQILPLDVYETEDNLVVEAALPGFDPDAVEITISKDELTITAERNSESDETNNYHLRERPIASKVERTITLPDTINADAAEATFKNGVLTLTLPKAEETKPKRITVKAK